MSEIETADTILRCSEFLPGQICDIDQSLQAEIARIILDETIEIPTDNRGNAVTYGEMEDAEFAELFVPLIDILKLDPAVDSPPLRTSLDRASRLGIVPSQKSIYARMTISKLQSQLGFRPKFRFQDWLRSDYIEAGRRLAGIVGGRPTKFDVKAASKDEIEGLGDFPTLDEIRGRFNKLSIYQELIGYPHCSGWCEDDYLEWADAFYRQNPQKNITARNLNHLSKRGVGPSRQAIYLHFPSLTKFQSFTKEYHKAQVVEELAYRQERTSEAEDLIAQHEVLSKAVVDQLDRQDKKLRIAAQMKVVRHLLPDLSINEQYDAAQLKDSDVFSRRCIVKSDGTVTAADVEITASVMGVFDDMWPLYRFSSVDLKI